MSDQPVCGFESGFEVRRQIWESLVSMVRVYAYAAGLNGDVYGVSSNHPEAVWVTYGEAALRVSYSPQSGAALWRLETTGRHAQGTFHIDDVGRVIFPEGPRELDDAAIHWVQQLGKFCRESVGSTASAHAV